MWSIAASHQLVDRHHEPEADEGHQQPATHEARHHNHGDPADHGHHLPLFLAINPITPADRSPEQVGEEIARFKEL